MAFRIEVDTESLAGLIDELRSLVEDDGMRGHCASSIGPCLGKSRGAATTALSKYDAELDSMAEGLHRLMEAALGFLIEAHGSYAENEEEAAGGLRRGGRSPIE